MLRRRELDLLFDRPLEFERLLDTDRIEAALETERPLETERELERPLLMDLFWRASSPERRSGWLFTRRSRRDRERERELEFPRELDLERELELLLDCCRVRRPRTRGLPRATWAASRDWEIACP